MFNFHHHTIETENGIYNLSPGETLPNSFFSVGIHPADTGQDLEAKMEMIKKTSRNPLCLAIGECGLDALVNTDEKTQEKVFLEQIYWANEIRKPIIIHCVRRYKEVIQLSKYAEVPMIIHGFNRKKNIAVELLNQGFYLSFGKALLQNVSLQHIFAEIPQEKIFLETDDAYFDFGELYSTAAKLKGMEKRDFENQILKNLETIKNG